MEEFEKLSWWTNVNDEHLRKVQNYPIQQQIDELERKCFKKALERSTFKNGSMMWKLIDEDLKDLIEQKDDLKRRLK